MNLQQVAERLVHQNIKTGIIDRVKEQNDNFEISSGGWCYMIPKKFGTEPKAGQPITFYLTRGTHVQGIDLAGHPLFYKTKADLETERQEMLTEIEQRKAIRKIQFFRDLADPQSNFNLRLNRLPKVFKQRFAKFFRLGEDFWDLAWYELAACETAVKIAYTFKNSRGISQFYNMSWEQQCASIPSMDDGLSGNQLGFACAMAKVYLYDSKAVRRIRGAMSPLTSSKPYIGR